MRYFMRSVLTGSVMLLAMIGMHSCDTYEEDELMSSLTQQVNTHIQKNYAVLPASPILIDLATQIQSSTALSFKLTSSPTQGTVHFLEKGILRYTPDANITSGKDIISYEIRGINANGTIKDTLSITITTDTTAFSCPLAMADQYTVPLNTGVKLDVLGNDLLCNSLDTAAQNATLLLIEEPQHGTASVVQNGVIVYTPNDNYTGEDLLIYQLCVQRDSAVCSLAQVSLKVGLPMDTCVLQANDDFIITKSGMSDTLLVDILSNDSLCISRDQVAVTLTPANDSTQLQLTPNKDVILTYDNTKNSIHKFTYTVCTPNDVCAQANVVVEIFKDTLSTVDTCQLVLNDDHFVFDISDSVGLDSTTSYALSVLINDQVCHPARSTLKVIKGPYKGSAEVSHEAIRYTPSDPYFSGQDSLRYQVCYPADTGCVSASVLVDFK